MRKFIRGSVTVAPLFILVLGACLIEGAGYAWNQWWEFWRYKVGLRGNRKKCVELALYVVWSTTLWFGVAVWVGVSV